LSIVLKLYRIAGKDFEILSVKPKLIDCPKTNPRFKKQSSLLSFTKKAGVVGSSLQKKNEIFLLFLVENDARQEILISLELFVTHPT